MSANPTSGGSEFFRLTELAPAFEWQCDHCGRRNFVSAVRLEPEACRDLIEDDPELAGLDPEDLDGEFLQRPEVVGLDPRGHLGGDEEDGKAAHDVFRAAIRPRVELSKALSGCLCWVKNWF